MRLHPAVLILIWSTLTAALQMLPPHKLLALSGVILLCVLVSSKHKFIALVHRTRWIMLSLLLIYAYSTPGQALLDLLGMLSPTREGLVDGMLQLLRLLAALAGLAILLEYLKRQQLMAGLYTLFTPLQWLGMSRERLTVRLALTLHYAEVAMLRGTTDWKNTLRNLFDPHEEAVKRIELTLYRLGVVDMVALLAVFMTVWMLLR